jgi:hypothetical protein
MDEKQTEEYLTEETHNLTGSGRIARQRDDVPHLLDHLRRVRVDDAYTEAELVDWATRRVRRRPRLHDAFRSNMKPPRHEIRRQSGTTNRPGAVRRLTQQRRVAQWSSLRPPITDLG